MISIFTQHADATRGGSLRFGWRAALVALGLATASPQGQKAQQRGESWDGLGCADVGRRPDRDIIEVGGHEGWFKSLRLAVTGNDVNIESLKVVYADGQSDTLRIMSEFREGTKTRPIDLKGEYRKINRIEIVSKRGYRGRGRGVGRICVAGLKLDRPRPGPGPGRPNVACEQPGCQKVGFLRDKDSINVGRRDGSFRAIRLQVSRNDVHINRLVVIYGNGEPDRIAVNASIREGRMAGP